MTYNFDPDKWYANELALLEQRFNKKKMTRGEFENAVDDLDQRYDDMLDRLDGTYQLPPSTGGNSDRTGH